MSLDNQDSVFSTGIPLRLPLSPAVNNVDTFHDFHMLSNLNSQDATDLKQLSEDATRELPSSNFTRFSHFSGNT